MPPKKPKIPQQDKKREPQPPENKKSQHPEDKKSQPPENKKRQTYRLDPGSVSSQSTDKSQEQSKDLAVQGVKKDQVDRGQSQRLHTEVRQKIIAIEQLIGELHTDEARTQKKANTKATDVKQNSATSDSIFVEDSLSDLSKIFSWIEEQISLMKEIDQKVTKITDSIEEAGKSETAKPEAAPNSKATTKKDSKENKKDKSSSESVLIKLAKLNSRIEKQLKSQTTNEQTQAYSGTKLLRGKLQTARETQQDPDSKQMQDIIQATANLINRQDNRSNEPGKQNVKDDKGKKTKTTEILLSELQQINTWVKEQICKSGDFEAMIAGWLENMEREISTNDPVEMPRFNFGISSFTTKSLAQIDHFVKTLKSRTKQLQEELSESDKRIQQGLQHFEVLRDICQQRLKQSSKKYKALTTDEKCNITKLGEATVEMMADLNESIAEIEKNYQEASKESMGLKQEKIQLEERLSKLNRLEEQLAEYDKHVRQAIKNFQLARDVCQQQLKQYSKWTYKPLSKEEECDISKVGEITVEMMTDLNERITEIDKNYQEARKESRELSQEKRQLENKISELNNRLSKYMGADLMVGNPNIADLSDTNRPTKLAETYSELYDNDWTNAFEELDKRTEWKEPEIIKSLLEVLEVAFECCKEAAENQLKGLESHCCTPTMKLVKMGKENNEDVKPDPVSQQAFVDLRKKTWYLAAADIFKHHEEIMKYEKKWKETYHSDPCKKYIKSCIDLCWLMVIQSPPLYIGFRIDKTNKFETSKYKEYSKKGKKIDFVVWPPLYLHKDGPLLCKGVAEGK